MQIQNGNAIMVLTDYFTYGLSKHVMDLNKVGHLTLVLNRESILLIAEEEVDVDLPPNTSTLFTKALFLLKV